MRNLTCTAVVMAILFCAGLAAPATADVIYTLTFTKGQTNFGTGVLDLNLGSLSAAYGLDQSLAPILVSITTPNLDNNGSFTITPTDLASGSLISTSPTSNPPAGHIYTLTAGQVEPASDQSGATNILFLDLSTNSWTISGKYDQNMDSGSFSIAGPTLSAAAVPEPITVSLFGAGFAGIAAMRRRKKPQRA